MPRKHRKPPQLLDLKAAVIQQEQRVKQSLCSFGFLVSAVRTLVLVFFYYIFSIGLTFYNQHMFHNKGVALSVTMCHLVFKFAMAGLVRWLLQCRSHQERVTLEWGLYVKRVAAAGIVSSLDIGLSNWSFELITVSLYTMSKSTAVIFILFFSILFKLERFRWSLLVIVSSIFLGLFLFTYESTQFNLEGFILVMTASLLSGLRWALAQLVMQKNEIGLHNPIDMMYHIQPWMILALLPVSATMEGLTIAASSDYFNFSEWSDLLKTSGAVLLGAVMGFMLEFSEFLLVSKTSGLTLSVSGIFKELCILLLAVMINHDPISGLNAVGLFMCLIGISVHVISKAVNSNDEKSGKKYDDGTSESVEMLTRNGEAMEDSEDSEVDLFSVNRDRSR